jgi:hypothetical protein
MLRPCETHPCLFVDEALHTARVFKGYNERPAPVLSPAMRVCAFLARNGGQYPEARLVMMLALTFQWTHDETHALVAQLRKYKYTGTHRGNVRLLVDKTIVG